MYIPYAEIREPFYAWYDGKSGSSRIDYYGGNQWIFNGSNEPISMSVLLDLCEQAQFVSPGVVKTFQLASKGLYGTSIKVAPITTESITNEETCLQVNGSSDFKIHPQSIIPDTTGMEVYDYSSLVTLDNLYVNGI